MNTVEDEFHLISECPLYTTLKEQFLDPIITQYPTVITLSKVEKAIWLLSNEERIVCKAMGVNV